LATTLRDAIVTRQRANLATSITGGRLMYDAVLHTPRAARLLFRVSREAETTLRKAFRDSVGIFCLTDAELLRRLGEGPTRGIVVQIDLETGETGPVSKSLLHAIAGQSVLLHTALAPGSAQQIVTMAGRACDLRVSLDGFDELVRQTQMLLAKSAEPTAWQTIVDGVVPRIDSSIRDIVVAAAIRGERRLEVLSFANACRLPVRSLQARLSDSGSPTARELLGWSLSLHACWRLEMLRWTPKQVANAAGFHGLAALGGFLERHVGTRPREMKTPGTLALILARFVRSFRVAVALNGRG
jgi:hypothetical protein